MSALADLLVTQVGTLETLVAVLLFVRTLPRRRAYPLRVFGFFLALGLVPVLAFGTYAVAHGDILLGSSELSALTLASSLGTLCVMALGGMCRRRDGLYHAKHREQHREFLAFPPQAKRHGRFL